MNMIRLGVSVSKRKECNGCSRSMEKGEKIVAAITSVFYGHANDGHLCRDCFLSFVYDYDPKILKKGVRDKIEQIKVAKRV